MLYLGLFSHALLVDWHDSENQPHVSWNHYESLEEAENALQELSEKSEKMGLLGQHMELVEFLDDKGNYNVLKVYKSPK